MKSSFSRCSNYSLFPVTLRLDSSDVFFLVSRFHCEQHRYLRKRISPPLSPLLQTPPASSYSLSSPSRISSQHRCMRKRIVPSFLLCIKILLLPFFFIISQNILTTSSSNTGFMFHCEQHRYLRKQIIPPLSPLLQNRPAFSNFPSFLVLFGSRQSLE